MTPRKTPKKNTSNRPSKIRQFGPKCYEASAAETRVVGPINECVNEVNQELKSKISDLEKDVASHLTRAIERDRMRGSEITALSADFKNSRTILAINSFLIGGLIVAVAYLLNR